MPFNLRFAELTTAIGVQGGHQRLTAPGDAPDSPINGLFDPNKNSRVAGYIFNEFKFSNTTKAQIAGRIEQVNLSGMTPEFIPDTFADTTAIGPATPRNLSFTPKSASVGLIQNLPWDFVGKRDRAICRARAKAGGAVLAGRSRRDGDLRYRQPKSEDRSRQIRRSRSAAGQRTLPVRG